MTENVISNSLKQNLDIELISKITNTSIEAIEKIGEKLEKEVGQS